MAHGPRRIGARVRVTVTEAQKGPRAIRIRNLERDSNIQLILYFDFFLRRVAALAPAQVQLQDGLVPPGLDTLTGIQWGLNRISSQFRITDYSVDQAIPLLATLHRLRGEL